MPVHVGGKRTGKGWPIVERSGKVVGYSSSHEKAQSAANARNAAKHGWRPTGKRRRSQRKGRLRLRKR